MPHFFINYYELISVKYFKSPVMFTLHQIKIKHKSNMLSQITAKVYMNKQC